MNKIETKILNCSAIREAEKNMVFTARLTQRGHLIHNMEDLVRLYNSSAANLIWIATNSFARLVSAMTPPVT